ncbi:MAG: M20/M25/M40 family metallo-hydrolase [Armatimonadetes bacterium]|nr:M20/M25/M40 family metallo-hydrolase [Armatimonadota bacterium]
MEPLVDEVRTDAMGNLIGFKRGKGEKKLMLDAHIDQIGFLVSFIEDKGFVRFVPLGGFDPRNLMARRAVVHGREDLTGLMVYGGKPVHVQSEEDRRKELKVSDFYIDLGMSKEDVAARVSIGDQITLQQTTIEIGSLITGQALDDRLCVYIMLEALRRAQNAEVDIYAVAAVQEEVGLRGTGPAAYGIDPDIGLALDVTLACDTPGNGDAERIAVLGDGAAIKIMDSSVICNYKMVEFLKRLAEKNGVKYQMEILPRGGTDGAAIQRNRSGVPAGVLSTPIRYVHTTVECAHRDDIEASIVLTARFIESAHEGDFTL